jgi:hypothetical protein
MSLTLGFSLLAFQCRAGLTLDLPQPTQRHAVAHITRPHSPPTVRPIISQSLSSTPTPAPRLELRDASLYQDAILQFRAPTTQLITCGYYNGDVTQPRTADEGFDCRSDATLGLWGFCSTTVLSASVCKLAGVCVDSFSCTTGCGGLKERIRIKTLTW